MRVYSSRTLTTTAGYVDVLRDGGVPLVGNRAVAVVHGVDAAQNQAVVTSGERVLQLALVRECEVGHRVGHASDLRRELRAQREVLVAERRAEARLPVGQYAAQVLELLGVGLLGQQRVEVLVVFTDAL